MLFSFVSYGERFKKKKSQCATWGFDCKNEDEQHFSYRWLKWNGVLRIDFLFFIFFWKDLVIPRLLEIPVLIAVARDANNGKKYHILYKAWWQFQIGDNFFHKIQHGFLSSTTFLHFRYLGIIIQFSKKVYSFFSILWVCVSRFQCKLVA